MYGPLESTLLTQDCFSPVFVNNFAPADARYVNSVCCVKILCVANLDRGNYLE